MSSKLKIKSKYNYMIGNTGKYITNKWFDKAHSFSDSCSNVALVIRDNKYNYITKGGKFLSKVWFDIAYRFMDGRGCVFLAIKGWNYIDTKGNFISDKWFDNAQLFIGGYAIVTDYVKGDNVIDVNGNLISDTWYTHIIGIEDHENYEEAFSHIWYNDASCLDKGPLFRVYRGNNEWNIINKRGEVISDTWYYNILPFKYGYSIVYDTIRDRYNLINVYGKLISDVWFNEITQMSIYGNNHGVIALVHLTKTGWVFLNNKGKIIEMKWKEIKED